MTIELKEVGRRFGNQRIFRAINYHFHEGKSYAVLGGNGSGKSTLLSILYGALSPSEGKLIYRSDQVEILRQQAAFKMSIAAPYLELIEELSALEFLNFYQRFRKFEPDYNATRILQKAYLEDASHKEIRNFSSGMRQRLRLALSFFTQGEVILLDEPTSNLDPAGVEWYEKLLLEKASHKTLIIGSNYHEKEIALCDETLEINHFK